MEIHAYSDMKEQGKFEKNIKMKNNREFMDVIYTLKWMCWNTLIVQSVKTKFIRGSRYKCVQMVTTRYYEKRFETHESYDNPDFDFELEEISLKRS